MIRKQATTAITLHLTDSQLDIMDMALQAVAVSAGLLTKAQTRDLSRVRMMLDEAICEAEIERKE